MSDEMALAAALNVSLNKEHSARVNLKSGVKVSDEESRETEVISCAAAAITLYGVLRGLKSKPMELIQMFALGYVLRGYDSLLDFDLGEDEITRSVMLTLTAGSDPDLLTKLREAMNDD